MTWHVAKLWALRMLQAGAIGAVVRFECDIRPLFAHFLLGNVRFFHPPKRDLRGNRPVGELLSMSVASALYSMIISTYVAGV